MRSSTALRVLCLLCLVSLRVGGAQDTPGLRNEFFDQWHGKEGSLQDQQKQAETGYLASDANDFRQRVVWAGEGVDLVRDVPAASDVIERIIDEAAAVLRSGAALVRG